MSDGTVTLAASAAPLPSTPSRPRRSRATWALAQARHRRRCSPGRRASRWAPTSHTLVGWTFETSAIGPVIDGSPAGGPGLTPPRPSRPAQASGRRWPAARTRPGRHRTPPRRPAGPTDHHGCHPQPSSHRPRLLSCAGRRGRATAPTLVAPPVPIGSRSDDREPPHPCRVLLHEPPVVSSSPLQLDAVPPAEAVEAGHVEHLAGHAVGLGGVEDELGPGWTMSRSISAGRGWRCPRRCPR